MQPLSKWSLLLELPKLFARMKESKDREQYEGFKRDLAKIQQQLAALQTPMNQDFERVWPMITEIGEAERHFNTLQATYRGLASTWLLAMFGAVGILLKPAAEATTRAATDIVVAQATINQWMLVSGVGIAAVAGIMLLWMLDVLVYHRLLMKFYDAGRALEERYDWLPQVRNRPTDTGRVRKSIARFYLLISVPGTLFAVVGALKWLHWPWPSGLVAALILVGVVASCITLWRKQNDF